MDPVTVTATSAAVGLLAKARNAIKSLRQHELAEKHKQELSDLDDTVTELGDRLFAQQSEMLALLTEIGSLRAKVSETDAWNRRLAQYRTIETGGGSFVLQSIDADPEHFACPTCAESKREIHALHRVGAGHHTCGACRARFTTSAPNPPKFHTRPPGGGWMGR